MIPYPELYAKTKIYGKNEINIPTKKRDYIAHAVRGKTVLHVGCTDSPITEENHKRGGLLHSALCGSASEVTGIDLCEKGIDFLEKNGFSRLHVMDAEKMSFDRKFDVIVAGDLVEHLSNPGLFLKQVPGLLNPHGKLIITVPHAYSGYWAKSMWRRHHEIVNKDHCCYYSPKTLAALCGRFDLLPVGLRYLFGGTRSWKGKIVDRIPGMRKFVNWCRSQPTSPLMADHFLMTFMVKDDIDPNTTCYEI